MSSSTAPVEVRASDEGRERIRVALGLMLFVGLQLIAHYAALASAGGGVSVVAPLLLPGAIAAWAGFRSSARAGLCALLVLAVLAAACLLSPVAAHLLPLMCQLLITLALTWLFGHTLLPGAEPLVTQMARAVHGSLPSRIEVYTRRVTLAWTLFLAALSVLSVLLYWRFPIHVWSVFANLLLLPLVGMMFLAEYLYRWLTYRWFGHATLAQSVMAFQRLRAARAARMVHRRG